MSGSSRTPVPSATVWETRVILAMSPASPSLSSKEGSIRVYRISRSVIAQTMCTRLFESTTRDGLDIAVELL